MPLCKWHTFWMVRGLVCCFTVILFYIEWKWLLMEVSKCWNVEEFPKTPFKIKNFKTICKAQTVSYLEKIIQYTGIYRHLLSKNFENAVLGRLEMMQCNFFSDTNQKHVCWKTCRVGLQLCCGSIFFYHVAWVEVRKIIKVFWVKLYRKMSHPFSAVSAEFLLENLKLKDKLQIGGFESVIFWFKFCFLGLF